MHPVARLRRAARFLSCGCTAAALACAAGAAPAAPITCYFSGTVTGTGGTGADLAAQASAARLPSIPPPPRRRVADRPSTTRRCSRPVSR